jgi:hypothetical protein
LQLYGSHLRAASNDPKANALHHALEVFNLAANGVTVALNNLGALDTLSWK